MPRHAPAAGCAAVTPTPTSAEHAHQFAALYAAEFPRLTRWLRFQFALCLAEAEDVAQTAFARAWAASPTRTSQAYVRTIARNLAIDGARHAALPTTVRTVSEVCGDDAQVWEALAGPSPDRGPEEIVLCREELVTAQASVPRAVQRILAARAAGYSTHEIARALGTSPSAIKMAIHRAPETRHVRCRTRTTGEERPA